MDHVQYAGELFVGGYNCAQAVAVAFRDVTGLSEEFSARMAVSFGGGLGRLREVCGAVSGMALVAGLLYGSALCPDGDAGSVHSGRLHRGASCGQWLS